MCPPSLAAGVGQVLFSPACCTGRGDGEAAPWKLCVSSRWVALGICGWAQWDKGHGPNSNFTGTRPLVLWASPGMTALTRDQASSLIFWVEALTIFFRKFCLWLLKITVIKQNLSHCSWCCYCLQLTSFGFSLQHYLCRRAVAIIWEVSVHDMKTLELAVICSKLIGCCSSSNMQEAHCLHSGLNCIFCIIASIKEKEKNLCHVTEASRVVIFIAYICSTLLALSLNYYGPFAFFSQSLLLRRPVEMTVLWARTQQSCFYFTPLYENEESWHPKKNVDLCWNSPHPSCIHQYSCFDSHKRWQIGDADRNKVMDFY